MLTAPGLASREAGLHFVEDQQDIAFVADRPQFAQPFTPKMIVTAFALDRLDDDRRDIRSAFVNKLTNFHFRFFLSLDHVPFTF